MPLTKSAIKKMRQDKSRQEVNRGKIVALKKVLKETNNNPTTETLGKAFSYLDRAAKKGLIPKGRADRKKSRLSKLKIVSKAVAPAKKKSPVSKKKSG